MREIADEFATVADFLTIYIKEAHPEDEWQLGSNKSEDVCYTQPTDLAGRLAIARDFVQRFDYKIPIQVDRMDNTAMNAYSGWPERLYVIGADRHIAYKGGIGPFLFAPKEVHTWLTEHTP